MRLQLKLHFEQRGIVFGQLLLDSAKPQERYFPSVRDGITLNAIRTLEEKTHTVNGISDTLPMVPLVVASMSAKLNQAKSN